MNNKNLLSRVTNVLRNCPALERRHIVNLFTDLGYKPDSISRTYYEAREILELEKAKERAVNLELLLEQADTLNRWLIRILAFVLVFFTTILFF